MPPRSPGARARLLLLIIIIVPALACGDEGTECERHLGGLCGAPWALRPIEVGVVDAAPIDVDGDGVDEVAIVDGHTLTIAWEDRRLVTRSALGGPQRLAVADLDGDGRDDLVLATSQPAGLLRLRSRGDGRFDEDEALPLAEAALALAAADLDGDGAPELLVASQRTLTLVDGASEETRELALGRGPSDLELADLDGDGDLDVVVVDRKDGDLTSLLGDGAGGLTSAATLPIGPAADELELADIDGDGRVDAIVRASAHATAWIAAGDGAGGFDLPVEVALEGASGARGLAVSGPNEGGLATLLAPSIEGLAAWVIDQAAAPFGRSFITSSTPVTFVSDRVFGGDGFISKLVMEGGIRPIARRTIPAPDLSDASPLAAGDFDGDGRPDLALLDRACSLKIGLAIDGDLPSPTWLSGPDLWSCPQSLQAFDLSGDGRVDLLTGTYEGLQALIGDGLGGFVAGPPLDLAWPERPLLLAGPERPLLALLDAEEALHLLASDGAGVLEPLAAPSVEVWQIAAGDLDGDGDDDLLGIGLDSRLHPLLREGDALDARPSIDPVTLLPWTAEGLEGLALDDLDGDGRAEALLFVNTHLAVLADLDGPAPTLRIDHVLDEGDLRPHARTLVGDFDGDGSRDLAFLDHRELTLVRGVDGGFAGVAPTVDTALSASLDVADLEGDGRTEVLTAASDEVRVFEAVDVLLPKTSARLDLPHPSQDLLGPVEPVFGDFNGDGRVDALYTIGPSLTIAWGDDGRFRESVSTSWVSVAALAAADLDGDGRDEALLTRLSKTSTLHWDGAALVISGPDEGWTHPHVAARPGAADLDGDGVAEPLLVRRPSLDTPSFAIIRLLPSGESEEIFTAPTADPFACARQPSLQAGDLDGDGRDELVVVDGCGEFALLWNDGEGRLRPDPLAASAALIQGVGDLVAVRGSTLVRIAVDGRSLGDSTPIHRQVADLREVGDCNGDGRPDLLSVFASGAAVLLGSADDSFVDLGAVEAATTRCVDVDDDGLADLVSLKTSVIATRLRRGAP